MWRVIDSRIFPLLSLFICARCFNPFDDGQYDINWGGPVTLSEGQVTPVSMKKYAELIHCVCIEWSIVIKLT